MKNYYMHLINGLPGAYFPGEGVCHMGFYGKPNPLAASLKQIRREQKTTIEQRRARGLEVDEDKYGYRRVCLPDEL